MKTIKMFLAVAALLFTISFANAQTHPKDSTQKKTKTMPKKVYTCTMHPDVISDKPGKCPKCGMDLVEKKPAKTKHKM
jgi:Heavy metal binding domain